MTSTVRPPRSLWQLASLWVSGVCTAALLSSVVVLGAAGRVTDPVASIQLAASSARGLMSAGEQVAAAADLTLTTTSGRTARGAGPDAASPAVDAGATEQQPAPPPAAALPATTDAAATHTAMAASRGETVSTAAGTVRVAIDGAVVSVVYATPGRGYSVRIEGDGTAHLRVELHSHKAMTRIDAWAMGTPPMLHVTVTEHDVSRRAPKEDATKRKVDPTSKHEKSSDTSKDKKAQGKADKEKEKKADDAEKAREKADKEREKKADDAEKAREKADKDKAKKADDARKARDKADKDKDDDDEDEDDD